MLLFLSLLIILRHFLSVTTLLAIFVTAANGQQGVMTGYERSVRQDQPADPADLEEPETPAVQSNYTTVFTRIVGTDAWRESIGGLRNVGSGTIGINGVNGTVTRAYLYWHGVANSVDPSVNRSIRVNGFTVLGTPIGTSFDNNWQNYEVSQAYRADVTHLVVSSPNKPYLLSNFGTGDFNPNGASLIIFHNDADSTNDYDVTIVNGNDSNGASIYDSSGWEANFGQIYDYGVAGDSFDLIVADGQTPYDPTLFLNGNVLRNAGPLYQGNSVPSAGDGTDDGSLWDFREYNFDAYVVPNAFNNLRLTSAATSFPDYPDYTSLVAAIAYIPIGPERVFITNQRVGGNLSNTTQNALLGADVRLQANLYPEGLTGGSFSWTIASPYQIVSGSTNTNVLNVRWTEPGTYNVRVNYMRNGVTITGSMNVNVIVPTLSNFSASTNDTDRIKRGEFCSQIASTGAIYSLGCTPNTGIVFSATAQIPTSQLLTDPALSGIKFIQVGSEYRKVKVDIKKVPFIGADLHYWYDGRDECLTGRVSQQDVDSGWQSDGGQALGGITRRFSDGNTLSISTFDFPGHKLDTRPNLQASSIEFMFDAFYGETSFETYVYYFVGGDPLNPIFQQPLRLASDNNFLYHRIPWTWKGQVYFDRQLSPATFYILQFTNTTQGTVTASGTNSTRTTSRGLASNPYRPCPGEPSPTNNVIDGTRFFVRELYRRVLGREPEDDGWDDWTSVITRCAFDSDCIRSKRILTARGFLESPEHFANNPLLANPGSETYNREYVRLCYMYFLGRQPDQGGWDSWTNYINTHPGDYDTVIHGFIYSIEFRDDFPAP